MKTKRASAVALAATCLILTFASSAAAADNWKWSLTPYIWASDLSEDLIFRDKVIGGSDLTFENLLDITEAAYTVHLQGMNGELGFYVDASISDLKDENVGDLVLTEVRIKEQIYSGGLIFRPGGESGNFNLLLGARYFTIDETYTFTTANLPQRVRGIDDSYTDLMVGARYKWLLGDRWALGIIGDISSGGTRMIWTAEGLLGWRFGARRQSAVLVGYRHRTLDYVKADDRIEVERTFSGPIFAVQFGF